VLGITLILTLLFTSFVPTNLANTDKIMYKAAYKLTGDVVTELIHDQITYNLGTLTDGNTTSHDFCNNFLTRVNTIGTTNCTASTIPGSPNFITSNGMRWYGFEQDFDAFPANSTLSFRVDVNGVSKGNNTNTTDILEIDVKSDGNVSRPTGGFEQQYIP